MNVKTSWRRALRVVCAGLALAATTAIAQEPIRIGAFLSVTGPAAFLGDPAAPDIVRRGRWLVRAMLSLLAMPGADEREERAMIEEFVAPVVAPARARPRRRSP